MRPSVLGSTLESQLRRAFNLDAKVALNQRRNVSSGHLTKKLRNVTGGSSLHKAQDKHEQAGSPSEIMKEKEKFLRERAFMVTEFNDLFGEQEVSAITKDMSDDRFIKGALHMMNLLRPTADPFHKADAKLSMEARLNAATGATGTIDTLQFNLPVLDTKAFMLAVEAVTASMADDLEDLLHALNVTEDLPPKGDPLRFKRLVDILGSTFALRKDPGAAEDWANRCWPKLRSILPGPFQSVTNEQMASWLRGHLSRVLEHQRLAAEGHGLKVQAHNGHSPADSSNQLALQASTRLQAQWYDPGEDSIYDSWPLPSQLVDELNVRMSNFGNDRSQSAFPFDKTGDLFDSFARALGWNLQSASVTQARESFIHMITDLRDIGLDNWLQMPTDELEQHLPQGPLPALDYAGETVLNGARMMLRAAARGKGSLLDFEALDPYALLHAEPGYQAQTIEEELAKVPSPAALQMSDEEIDKLLDVSEAARVLTGNIKRFMPAELENFLSEHGKTPLELLLDHEAQQVGSIGPGQWTVEEGKLGDWRWATPASSVMDVRTGQYVRENAVVDPNLRLDKLRQLVIDMRRCQTMTINGKIGYHRAIIAVGDGRGLFGYGVGFGRSPENARGDASQKAIKNLERVDLDEGKTLTFPVRGNEYSASVIISPSYIGTGIDAKARTLPLAFLTGIENAKIRFPSRAEKLPKMRALRRALDRITSRKTLAESTGKKYAEIVAPGDHWVHWPDRWFRPIAQSYAERIKSLRNLRPVAYRASGEGRKARVAEVVPTDLRPEKTRYTRQTALEKWTAFHSKRMQTAFDAWTPIGTVSGSSELDKQLRQTVTQQASQAVAGQTSAAQVASGGEGSKQISQ